MGWLVKLAVMLVAIGAGVATDHILWGFWGGFLAVLVILAVERRKAAASE